MKKNIEKIGEFLPFSGEEVTSVSLGKRSGQLFIAGNTKGNITLFQIKTMGQSRVSFEELISLSGFSNAVTCVKFDDVESHVLAGTIGGSVRVWTLGKNQQSKLFTPGHRSNVTVLSWNYNSKFFATGSLDTNVKLWNREKKKNIKLYKGHNAEISALEFSPDGKILVSGDNKGIIFVWLLDSRSLKPKHELKFHRNRITTFCFHPGDLVLACGSKDKTSSVWDVDTFMKIGRTIKTTTSVSKVIILDGVEDAKDQNSEHDKLVICYHDQVKIWRWEPMVLMEEFLVKWHNIQDAVHLSDQNKILILDCNQAKGRIITWIFDLRPLHITNESLTHVLPSEQAKERGKRGLWSREDDFKPVESTTTTRSTIRKKAKVRTESSQTSGTSTRKSQSPVRKSRSPVRRNISSSSSSSSKEGKYGGSSSHSSSTTTTGRKKRIPSSSNPVDQEFKQFCEMLGFKVSKKSSSRGGKGIGDVPESLLYMDVLILRTQNFEFFRRLWRKKVDVVAKTVEEKEQRIDDILKFQLESLNFLEKTCDPGLVYMVMKNIFESDIKVTMDIIHHSAYIDDVYRIDERRLKRKKLAERLFAKLLNHQLDLLRTHVVHFMKCGMNGITILIKTESSKRKRNWKKVFSENERIVGMIRSIKEEIRGWRIEDFGNDLFQIGENLFGELLSKS